MNWLAALLPVTVVAAFLLFILKELLEWIRRYRTDVRKAKAFRILLARECELNYWAYGRLKKTLEIIKSGLDGEEPEHFAISQGEHSEIRFEHYLHDTSRGSWPLSDFHTDIMNKVMLDVAILDEELYSKLDAAFDAVAELKHVRQILLELVSGEQEEDKAHLEGFPDYGLPVLKEALKDLKALYKTCTGEWKIPPRLR